MKNIAKCLLVVLLMFLAFNPSPALAQSSTPQPGNEIVGDQVIIGNTFRLESGETLQGSLLVIGGTASTAETSKVNGDLLLIGGTLTIAGEVNGDIVSIGGAVNLEDPAVINGDLSLLGANLQRSAGAIINGGVSEDTPNFLNNNQPGQITRWFPFTSNRTPLRKVLTTTFQSLAMGILAVLIGLLLPRNLKNIASTVVHEPLVSGGVGLLTALVMPIILVLLMITILLIPVSVLGFIALGLAFLLGFIVVGYEVGQRLAGLFKTSWHPSIAAGVGTLLLSLVTGVANFIPCIGWVLGFIAGIVGLGAVITSRVGSERYANKLLQAVLPVAPIPSAAVPTESPTTDSTGQPPVPPEG